ncbi:MULTISPECIES: DNA starvation/stationary phase protection protein [Brevibacterium]|uniref:Starvation-inducible DNA-binding protein n=1 Tax=Brevibacterium antiquum CNRZ 918 TaxID=1255637 RepID=A0A2H1KVV1_9MICO|nr:MULTISPECIES: DNA starvation/stationary phase protection protein [Brevibacterium]SMY03778.1 starvation-inducible DNA-binding protein [Brevibacterium antiquum CNRZ 918]HCG54693.1 DNA starvation/stationary phase protection protein [Brevibacterium sp.]
MVDTVGVPQSAGAKTTKTENAEHGFEASPSLAKNLQTVLVDFIALQLVGKQAHWNVVGPNFRDLHLNLDEVVSIAREGADTIAERMRALHATADGRPAVVAEQTALPEFPAGEVHTHDAIDLAVRAVETTVATMRGVHDEVDEVDPTTADIFHDFIGQLEQQAWFLSAETRQPSN